MVCPDRLQRLEDDGERSAWAEMGGGRGIGGPRVSAQTWNPDRKLIVLRRAVKRDIGWAGGSKVAAQPVVDPVDQLELGRRCGRPGGRGVEYQVAARSDGQRVRWVCGGQLWGIRQRKKRGKGLAGSASAGSSLSGVWRGWRPKSRWGQLATRVCVGGDAKSPCESCRMGRPARDGVGVSDAGWRRTSSGQSPARVKGVPRV